MEILQTLSNCFGNGQSNDNYLIYYHDLLTELLAYEAYLSPTIGELRYCQIQFCWHQGDNIQVLQDVGEVQLWCKWLKIQNSKGGNDRPQSSDFVNAKRMYKFKTTNV